MITDFPTAPLAPGLRGAGGSTVEKSLSASHTEILTLPPRFPDQNVNDSRCRKDRDAGSQKENRLDQSLFDMPAMVFF